MRLFALRRVKESAASPPRDCAFLCALLRRSGGAASVGLSPPLAHSQLQPAGPERLLSNHAAGDEVMWFEEEGVTKKPQITPDRSSMDAACYAGKGKPSFERTEAAQESADLQHVKKYISMTTSQAVLVQETPI